MRVDYTKYAEGNAVSAAGIITKCPMCGRNGEKRPSTKRYACIVVHAADVVLSVGPKRHRPMSMGGGHDCAAPSEGRVRRPLSRDARATRIEGSLVA